MQSSNNIYLERVDILRFVAATLVIFWHYFHYGTIPHEVLPHHFSLSVLEEGHTGVSLFIVLSGFIFQYINSGKEISYFKFLRNRFFRIFPLAIFWILIYVAKDHLNPVEVLLNTIFVFNPLSVPGVGWTIIVEFQFYLIFPVFHKIIERKGGTLNIVGLFVLMILLRGMLYINTGNMRDFAYYSIFGRLDQFLLGVIAAKLYANRLSSFFSRPELEKLRLFLLAGVVAGLLVVFHFFVMAGGYFGVDNEHGKGAAWIVFLDVEALFYASIIVLYLSLNKYALLRPVESFFAKLGEFSYSMYWLHWPMILALCVIIMRLNIFNPGPRSFASMWLIGFAVILPAIVFVSALSYTFFEKPFLRFREKYTT